MVVGSKISGTMAQKAPTSPEKKRSAGLTDKVLGAHPPPPPRKLRKPGVGALLVFWTTKRLFA